MSAKRFAVWWFEYTREFVGEWNTYSAALQCARLVSRRGFDAVLQQLDAAGKELAYEVYSASLSEHLDDNVITVGVFSPDVPARPSAQ